MTDNLDQLGFRRATVLFYPATMREATFLTPFRGSYRAIKINQTTQQMIDGWELLTRLKKLHWMLDEGSPELYIVNSKKPDDGRNDSDRGCQRNVFLAL
jgi:hypothetical protein